MVYLLVMTILFPFWAFASPAEEIPEHSIPILDTVQHLLGTQVNNLANDFDSFFATERADDELGRSRIRIRRRYTVEERALLNEETFLRFNIRLPSLERRFKDIVSETKEKKGETEEEKLERARRYIQATELDTRWLFRSDVAINASIHPNITARGRLRKSMKTKEIIHRFVQEATWRSYQEGFRHRTQFFSDYSINSSLLFRFNNLVDWRISQKDFSTTHGPSLLQRLNEDSALAYAYNATTVVHNGVWYLSQHLVQSYYRRNIYHQFIYMDVGGGLRFPKIWSFRRTPFVFIQIEALFGG